MKGREAIDAAYQDLQILPGLESRVQDMVNEIATIDVDYKSYVGFKKIGRGGCQKELKRLNKLASKLAECVKNLHAPTLVALSDRNFGKFGPHQVYTIDNDRMLLQRLCEKLADAAERANVSNIPLKIKGGRPENLVANDLTNLLAHHFLELTGKRPTIRVKEEDGKAYGPFIKFLEAIFLSIGLKAKPEAAAKHWKKNIQKQLVASKEKKQKKRGNKLL